MKSLLIIFIVSLMFFVACGSKAKIVQLESENAEMKTEIERLLAVEDSYNELVAEYDVLVKNVGSMTASIGANESELIALRSADGDNIEKIQSLQGENDSLREEIEAMTLRIEQIEALLYSAGHYLDEELNLYNDLEDAIPVYCGED